MRFLLYLLLMVLVGCSNENNNPNKTKAAFIDTIFDSDIDEGPFAMRYSLKTVLFSKKIISLFGHTDIFTHLPHSRGSYEGKTYCKINGKFKEIFLNDLFTTSEQKIYLKNYCEKNLKDRSYCYFASDYPIRLHLSINDIKTFVVDDKSLIIIFAPYCIGNYVDGLHIVKIPYEELKDHWNPQNPLAKLLPITNFVSSWDSENFYSQLPGA